MGKPVPKLRWFEWYVDTASPIHRLYLTVIGESSRIASAELHPSHNGWRCYRYNHDGLRPESWIGDAETPEEAMRLVIDVLEIDPDLVDSEIWEFSSWRTLPRSERERKVKDVRDVI